MEQKPIHVDIKFAIDSLRKEPELSKQKKKKNSRRITNSAQS